MSLFKELRAELNSYFNPEQISMIEKALRVAESAHQGQQRQSGEPYISHPVAVARILAGMRMDSATITAAILHDVLEDTPTDKETLVSEFGSEVAELVDGVSKLTQIHFETHAEAQAENFSKMLLAMTKDIRVILVKLADRLHNMRTLAGLPIAKQRRVSAETFEIYAPIAHRLGMHNFRIEFEDLAFSVLFPLRFRALQSAVAKARGRRKQILSTIRQDLKQALAREHFSSSSVVGRQKHVYGIYQKMRRGHVTFAEVMDVYGFRIIVSDVSDCYRVLGIVHNLYKPVPARFKDYIAIPKANGYQSLHTTLFGPYGLPVEIQVRTAEMDKVADNGIAAHWLYKSESGQPSDAEIRARDWLKRLLDMQQKTGNSLEFIENVKIELFNDEVYVFTPKGKILELPLRATPIDFAYAVHSDIGDKCVAVKIDRRFAPLSTTLRNGQTVEIITAADASPNPDWLNFVVTGKARSHIRHFLNTQRRVASEALGKSLLNNALATLSSTWAEVPDQNCKDLLKELDYQTPGDLFEAIGLGYQQALSISRRLLKLDERKSANRDSATLPNVSFSIKGTEGMVVRFADCCRPIPGDSIVGMVNAGQGIEVHTTRCRVARDLSYHHSMLVSWAEEISSDFKVDVKVDLFNRRGVLAQLAAAIAEMRSDIDNIRVEQHDSHYSTVRLTLLVRGRLHLARVMRKIRRLNVVLRIVRSRHYSNI